MTTIESHVDENGNIVLYFPGRLRLHIAPRATDTGTTNRISAPAQRLLPAGPDSFLNRFGHPQAQVQSQGGPPMPADWHLHRLPRQVPNAGNGPSNNPPNLLTRMPSLANPSASGQVFNLENDLDPGNEYRDNRDEWTSVGEFTLHNRDEIAETCFIS
jgi:hypothetical protein